MKEQHTAFTAPVLLSKTAPLCPYIDMHIDKLHKFQNWCCMGPVRASRVKASGRGCAAVADRAAQYHSADQLCLAGNTVTSMRSNACSSVLLIVLPAGSGSCCRHQQCGQAVLKVQRYAHGFALRQRAGTDALDQLQLLPYSSLH
jgi:hypothetical protein